MRALKVNKELVLVKLHFFLFNAALSGTIPFLPVYAKQLGISAMRVGVIFTVLSFLGLVTKPTFGLVADRFRNVRLMLIVLLAIVTVTMLGLNFIPPAEKRTSADSCLSNDTANATTLENAQNCDEFCKLCKNCTITSILPFNCSGVLYNGALDENCSSVANETLCQRLCNTVHHSAVGKECYDDRNTVLQFGLFTALVIGAWASFNVAVTLTDAACYTVLQDKVHLYGRQRLWGVVGWGTFAALTGYLNNVATAYSDGYDYSPGFYILTILLLLDMVAVRYLRINNSLVSKAIFADVGKLLKNPRIAVFLAGTFAIGALTGLIRCYLFWYLRLQEASQLLLGLASGSQCFLGELPFFFFSGWIIKKLGQVNVVTMSFFAYGLRFLGYWFMRNPWWTLFLEMLQGPSYAVFYAAMTSYAKTVAYPGTEATVQGLLGGTFEGLGIATGNLLGGVGFSFNAARSTFACASVVGFSGAAIFALTQKLLTKFSEDDRCRTEPVPSPLTKSSFDDKTKECTFIVNENLE